MNWRQMVVAWIATLLLTAISVLHGLFNEGGLFFGIVLPILMVAGLLTYQLRDKRPPRNGESSGNAIKRVLAIAIVVQCALLYGEWDTRRMLAEAEDKATEIESSVSGVESSVSDLESSVSDLDSRVSELEP